MAYNKPSAQQQDVGADRLVVMNYAVRKSLPNYCGTCRHIHSDERHQRRLEYDRRRSRERYQSTIYKEHFRKYRRSRYQNNLVYRQQVLSYNSQWESTNRKRIGYEEPLPDYYPYGPVVSPLLEAVIEAVTRNIPEDIRAETCQQMLLAILEGRLKLDEIQSRSREFINATYRMLYDGWKIRSICEPAFQDSKILLQEVIEDPKLICEDCGSPTDFGMCSICSAA